MQLAPSAGKNAIASKRQKTYKQIQVRENMPMAAKEKNATDYKRWCKGKIGTNVQEECAFRLIFNN